jgi:hydroxymethylpyrimidine/phosphomethylpyrimidine kinase
MINRPSPIPITLTIAGSDSSGGAGIQADLRTFSAFGVYGASVVTALTAQNTRGVDGVLEIAPSFVMAQLRSVLSDLTVRAAKTGMLANKEIVLVVADALDAHPDFPLVVDPVMVATSGEVLLEARAVDAAKQRLFPRAALLTPNLPEAALLLGANEARDEGEMVAQAKALAASGCRSVLLKGGHGAGELAVDVLVHHRAVTRFETPRVETPHTHGAGCTLSAAITALLASGATLLTAVERAKGYVWRAIQSGQSLGVGHGRGPLDHLFAIRASEASA